MEPVLYDPREVPGRYKGGRKSIYPWADWLNGREWVLKQGVHFEIDAREFRTRIHIAAKRWGVKAVVRRKRNSESLVVRAVKKRGGK